MGAAYYNEIDPFCVEWLRNLIREGLIAPGDVDDRSIKDVRASDLAGYTQCHFFAGIGGWSLAFRLAGWADDEAVWSGSCPCQPFSDAGKKKGVEDERHLWPWLQQLIAECRPSVCFGEQVASAAGRGWLAGVRADVEALAYRLGAADLCAASTGAPHIRQRLYWVADTRETECAGRPAGRRRNEARVLVPGSSSAVGGMGNAAGAGSQGSRSEFSRRGDQQFAAESSGWTDFELIDCSDGKARRVEPGTFPLAHAWPDRSMGPLRAVLERMGCDSGVVERAVRNARGTLAGAGRNRVGRLRGYGNAIVPAVAAEFIRAYCEARELIS